MSSLSIEAMKCLFFRLNFKLVEFNIDPLLYKIIGSKTSYALRYKDEKGVYCTNVKAFISDLALYVDCSAMSSIYTLNRIIVGSIYFTVSSKGGAFKIDNPYFNSTFEELQILSDLYKNDNCFISKM